MSPKVRQGANAKALGTTGRSIVGQQSMIGKRGAGGHRNGVAGSATSQAAHRNESSLINIKNTSHAQQQARVQYVYVCAGCNKPIKRDKFLLKACDQYWHENCLRCDKCHTRLGELGSTLYNKSNMNLCRQDYLEMFGETGTCSVCNRLICASEMVMRAKKNVYHLECFACQLCSQRFCVGDRFYLCDNKIVCQYDYEEIYGIGVTTGPINSLTYPTPVDAMLPPMMQLQQPATTTATTTTMAAAAATTTNGLQMAHEPERISGGQCVDGEPHLTALMTSSSSAHDADHVISGGRRQVDRAEAAPRGCKMEESSHDGRVSQSTCTSGETFGRCLLSENTTTNNNNNNNNREPEVEAGR